MPEEAPRPTSLTPTARAGQAGVVYAIATIFSWVIGIALKALPPELAPTAEVTGAFYLLAGSGAAALVAYVASRMRWAEYRDTGEVSGVKRYL